jgi:hypothetical protein
MHDAHNNNTCNKSLHTQNYHFDIIFQDLRTSLWEFYLKKKNKFIQNFSLGILFFLKKNKFIQNFPNLFLNPLKITPCDIPRLQAYISIS